MDEKSKSKNERKRDGNKSDSRGCATFSFVTAAAILPVIKINVIILQV